MRIYDGHMHIGGLTPPNPEKLLEELAQCGITGGNVISIDPDDVNFTYEQRMENLFKWVRGYEDRLFPVAWLHPYEKDIEDRIKDCIDRGVKAFKFIPNNYFVYDEKPSKVFHLIEETGLPIIFHAGILYDFLESSKYNKPMNWETFIGYKNLKFSLGHCGHPWYDEAVLVHGKFKWIEDHTKNAALGVPDIYYNNPWVVEHLRGEDNKEFEVPELYLDTTPGAHKAYRRDLLTKLHSYHPDAYKIFFGSDRYVEDYRPDIVKGWLDFEKEILDDVGASEAFRENMYKNNLFKFMGMENK